jgi:AraC-like DNA-binding protein
MEEIMVSQVTTDAKNYTPTIRHFDTSLVDQGSALSYWQDAICTVLSPTENARLEANDDFSASLRSIKIERVSLSRVTTSPLRYVRSPHAIRKLPNDEILVALVNEGSGELTQMGRKALCKAGDIAIYDSARPFTWIYPEKCLKQVVSVSRRALLSRLPNAEHLTARVIGSQLPLAQTLVSLFDSFDGLDHRADGIDFARFSSTFVDMLSAAIEFSLGNSELSPTQGDVLAQAKKLLLDNIEDAEFTFAQLVDQLGASPRTVCRLFAANGTTAIRWLWQQRLERAHRLLETGNLRNVSQVALRCGFSDFSHFSRAFKKTFAITPNELMRGPKRRDH